MDIIKALKKAIISNHEFESTDCHHLIYKAAFQTFHMLPSNTLCEVFNKIRYPNLFFM